MNSYIILLTVAYACSFVNAGYIHENGLGTDCLYDDDCITRNSFCKGNKICACKIGYQYDPGSDVCFPKEVHLKCSEDYDCSALPNAHCTNGVCQCRYDHVPARDKTECLPTMKLTSACQEDTQCYAVMPHSYCDTSKRSCLCERGYKKDEMKMECVPNEKRLHNICFSNNQCETSDDLKGKVTCKNNGNPLRGTCECADGFKEERDTCVQDNGSSQIVLSSAAFITLFIVKWIA